MCGIAGLFAYHPAAPSVDRAALQRTSAHMAARGPDAQGEWVAADDRVALAHRRLAIIDLSPGGAQPMASADGQLVISFNGEIYNHRELRAALEREGAVFRSHSDTEVLLQLYARKGRAMLPLLRGMFAFALWDGRSRSLLLARDAFGIKPLYLADDGRTLRLASQVKALLAGGGIDAAPEPAGHAGFFLWGSVPEPYTLYRGIRSLPAGHSQVFDARGPQPPEAFGGRISERLAAAAAKAARGSRADALAAITAALRDSVRAHQVADVPVGVFLSSGLDSALLAALAAPTPDAAASVQTLTLAFAEFAGQPQDEAPLAERLAAQLGTRHATVRIDRRAFEVDFDALLAAMDQPSIDGVNTWFVAKAAAAHGLKVALSGLGGDELFASYPSFADLPRLQRAARPFAALPGLGAGLRRLAAPVAGALTSPKYAGVAEYGGTLGGAYLLRRGLFMPWELPQLLPRELAEQGWRELGARAGIDALGLNLRPSRLAVSALEMQNYMRHQLLRDADWASMAHSLEVRVPLVDTVLLDAVAPWLAAHPDLTKPEVVAAAAPTLPRDLLRRPKTGFTVPVRDWLAGSAPHGRGLRGWARMIHARQASGVGVPA